MASLRRSSQNMSGSIWPGFVDAMTALLLVLMFVLTIFMVLQSMLRDTITGQESELDALGSEMAALAETLGLEQAKAVGLEEQIGTLRATLTSAREQAEDQAGQISAFEARVAELLAEQAAARGEIDAAEVEARLAAARQEALAALVSELKAEGADRAEALNAAEAARLVDAEALKSLRARLAGAHDEMTAMELALETARKEAEDTLTLLAAAEAAKERLEGAAAAQISEAERQAALLAVAQKELSQTEVRSADEARKLALLNEQVAQLRRQLGALQSTLDVRTSEGEAAEVEIAGLTTRLNAALAQVAAEEKQRAALEEAERKRLEEEAKRLENYRSEFFGRLREILGDREGVRVVGDRFVFSSEVLFEAGSANLGGEGRAQIARVAGILSEVSAEIPPEVDWVIRVDGHTDTQPLSGSGRYHDNWELSQARALSVVRYMSEELGFPASRLLAAGFGEYQPIARGTTPDALAQNRRIELKLTEK